MKEKSLFLVTALLTLAASCVSAKDACARNKHGIFEELPCASKAVAVADRELNNLYGALVKTLDPQERAALVKSQRAWLAFIEADADFKRVVQGDGADTRLVIVNAREAHTRARAQELKGLMAR